MHCIIAQDNRFVLNQGRPASFNTFYERFGQRYLDVFDSVTLLGRLFPIEDPTAKPIEGPGVTFVPMPAYTGPLQYLGKRWEIKARVRLAYSSKSALIIHPSTAGSALLDECKTNGHPYAIEVGADPYDILAPGSIKHPLRPLLRQILPRRLQHDCAMACAAMYVTKTALQKRYPCPSYSVGISDVVLSSSDRVEHPRVFSPQQTKFSFIMIGSLEQLYKAPHIVIEAIAICVKQGLDLCLNIVGEGKHRSELVAQADRLNIGERVCFLGKLPAGEAILTQLDQADIFIMPSFQEGLPRAMVEAMARGLPCIGSTVGGIPELLLAEDLVPPGDVNALAAKIRETVTSPDRMMQMSARNLETAKNYTEDVLRHQRINFYQIVKEKTEDWQRQQRLFEMS
jgi:glycosyltransferase involved in cell wall biosynthesis